MSFMIKLFFKFVNGGKMWLFCISCRGKITKERSSHSKTAGVLRNKKEAGMKKEADKEMALTGAQRLEMILKLLKNTSKPLSGGELGSRTGVSRQVVVQDIALLRSQGHEILATARGYLLDRPKQAVRLFKVCHSEEQTEDELLTIVDLGGRIEDVMVNHRAYGVISVPLGIKSRRDVSSFITNMKTGRSSPLMNVTSGYHFHHVSAESEEILDEIEKALKDKEYLAQFLPYENL